MDVKRFQEIAAVLLKKHYGLELNDTELHDDNIVRQYIEQGFRPYQVIAEHADESDLDRIDLDGGYGVPSKAPITEEDENLAVGALFFKASRHEPREPMQANPSKMFGRSDIEALVSQIEAGPTYRAGGGAMIVMGYLSDAQELLASGQPRDLEAARQIINIAKFLVDRYFSGPAATLAAAVVLRHRCLEISKRLLDSEEHAVESAVPGVAEEASVLLKEAASALATKIRDEERETWLAIFETTNTSNFAAGRSPKEALEGLLGHWKKFAAHHGADARFIADFKESVRLAPIKPGHGIGLAVTDKFWPENAMTGDDPSLEDVWLKLAQSPPDQPRKGMKP